MMVLCNLTCASSPEWQRLLRTESTQVVRIPPGTYHLDEGFVISGSKRKVVATDVIFTFDDDSELPLVTFENCRDCSISGLRITGPPIEPVQPRAFLERENLRYAMAARNCEGLSISDCHIESIYGTGIHLSDVSNASVTKSTFRNFGAKTPPGVTYSYDAIFVGGYKSTAHVQITDCEFDNIGASSAADNPPYGNDGDGIQIQGAGRVTDVEVRDCTFRGCAARGIKIQSGNSIAIVDNEFYSCSNPINFAMSRPVSRALVRGNTADTCLFFLESDCLSEPMTLSDYRVKSNSVGACARFLRTSGTSSVYDASIVNNRVGRISTCFAEGRFINTTFADNTVGSYGADLRWGYNHAIYLNSESEDVHILDNEFAKARPEADEIIIKTESAVEMRGNSFPATKTPKKF